VENKSIIKGIVWMNWKLNLQNQLKGNFFFQSNLIKNEEMMFLKIWISDSEGEEVPDIPIYFQIPLDYGAFELLSRTNAYNG
jgi:hypothetical protein